jgi:hypothetical protein
MRVWIPSCCPEGEPNVRLRMLTVAAVAALAVAGLGACRTNVGAAATIDGHRISESDVAKYLTSKAEGVPQQDANGGNTTIPARSWVLRTLLNERLYGKLLAASPNGTPAAGEIADAKEQLLQGSSEDTVAKQYADHGYQRAFGAVYLRAAALEQILRTEIQNGLDVTRILDKLKLSIHVNPRYGQWNSKTYELSTAPGAGLPDFLKLTSGTATASTS